MVDKVLIFTSKTGGGHVSLAEALRDILQDNCEVQIVDPQPSLVHWHYRLVSRHALWLWAAEYRSANTPRRSRAVQSASSILFSRSLTRVLRASHPDIVLSTYPFLTNAVTRAIRRIGRHVPFAMLFSDPNGVHQAWLTERNADAIFAPTHETHHQALACGFAPERIHLTGWPVRAQFYNQPSDIRLRILSQQRLDPARFTVFLQGGGEGAARFARTVDDILSGADAQILLAAGTNQALLERFRDSERVRAIPFTKEIAPYMAAADVVIGKAGPNILFESVTLGKPFIATAYIPGQEKVNLEFIRKHGLGWVALKPAERRALIASLVKEPARLQAMHSSVEEYRTWNNTALGTLRPVIHSMIEAAHARKPVEEFTAPENILPHGRG